VSDPKQAPHGLPAVSWDPSQYLRYDEPRLRPALDLFRTIEALEPATVVDLGCGTGAMARRFAARWPAASVSGVDLSSSMLERARDGSRSPAERRVEWIQADIAVWQPREPVDLIFSNAALHWLADHATLFPRLLELLRPGGALAVQMPLSFGLASHRLMRQALEQGDGHGPFGTPDLRRRMSTPPVLEAAHYYDLLAECASALDIWETEYLQALTGDDPVLEWVRGTGLRPILEALDAESAERFETAYRKLLREHYARRDDGTTLYPFRRLFLVARR
jgi:trans-aconitate 2-methyltransferase